MRRLRGRHMRSDYAGELKEVGWQAEAYRSCETTFSARTRRGLGRRRTRRRRTTVKRDGLSRSPLRSGSTKYTYPFRIRRSTLRWVIPIVELIYMLEQNDPTNPPTSRIKQRLNTPLHRIIELNPRLNLFRNMSPRQSDDATESGGNDVDDHGEPPRDEDVGCCPEEPCFNVVEDVAAFGGRVGFVPEEVDEDGAGYEKAGDEDRSDQGTEEKGEDPVET